MEELSKMAMAHYQASSDDIQKLVHDFFEAMDHDGDGKVDRREFLEFMRDEGYGQMTNPSFFNQLDLDNNGTLDFAEVMTVYYIVKSGRPFCDNCKKFITSTYLTCVGCLEDPDGGLSFYLCLDCYIMQKYHAHDGLCRFLDNCSLLEAMTKSKLNELRSMDQVKSRPTETNSNTGQPPIISDNYTWNPSSAIVLQDPYRPPTAIDQPPNQYNYHLSSQDGPSTPQGSVTNVYNSYHYQQHVVAPNAIVPHRNPWKVALGQLNTAIQIATIGSSFCSIL